MRRSPVRLFALCLSSAGLLACGVPANPAPPIVDLTAPMPSTSAGTLTPAIQVVLDDIRAVDEGLLAVSEEDGRFLRMLVAAQGAQSILEIGGASGYSAIWLGLGARQTGGHVVSIEYDPIRAAKSAANITRAGLTDVVEAIEGDAFAEIPALTGTFDFVFLDAWKPDYERFFELVFPRLAPGGLFVAHNVVNKRDELEGFLATVRAHPQLFTTIVQPSGEGMSVSYRVR